MARVGILTCSYTADEIGCNAFSCFRDASGCGGQFAKHSDDDGAQVIGMIVCAGCPTAVGSSRIIERVRSLYEMGLDSLHIANCVVAVCPFKEEFIDTIKENFPNLDIVIGSHGPTNTERAERYKALSEKILSEQNRTLRDLAGKPWEINR